MREGERRLLAILAHPDDESLGNGGMLAKYAEEGVATYLLTATRGERGWLGPPEEYPGPKELGRIREQELREAARHLGIREVILLDHVDGDLDRADPVGVVAALVRELRRVRPQVVVTFDPWGLYGHPDHIAISRFATEAVAVAARSDYGDGAPPHLVDGLYYMAWTQSSIELYSQAFGDIELRIGDEVRRPHPWPDWAISVRIDASDHWRTAWDAIACHHSQLPGYDALLELPEQYHRALWSNQTYVRVLGAAGSQGVATSLFDSAPAGGRSAERR